MEIKQVFPSQKFAHLICRIYCKAHDLTETQKIKTTNESFPENGSMANAE